jgi:hypothetical protein
MIGMWHLGFRSDFERLLFGQVMQNGNSKQTFPKYFVLKCFAHLTSCKMVYILTYKMIWCHGYQFVSKGRFDVVQISIIHLHKSALTYGVVKHEYFIALMNRWIRGLVYKVKGSLKRIKTKPILLYFGCTVCFINLGKLKLVKFCNGGLVLGLSPFLLLPQLPQKSTPDKKMVKNNWRNHLATTSI